MRNDVICSNCGCAVSLYELICPKCGWDLRTDPVEDDAPVADIDGAAKERKICDGYTYDI
jgi:hypothetical protein